MHSYISAQQNRNTRNFEEIYSVKVAYIKKQPSDETLKSQFIEIVT